MYSAATLTRICRKEELWHGCHPVQAVHKACLTKGVFALPEGSFSPLLYICKAPGPMRFVSVGLLLKGSSGTTSISGRRSTMALTCVVKPAESGQSQSMQHGDHAGASATYSN